MGVGIAGSCSLESAFDRDIFVSGDGPIGVVQLLLSAAALCLRVDESSEDQLFPLVGNEIWDFQPSLHNCRSSNIQFSTISEPSDPNLLPFIAFCPFILDT